MPSSSYGLAPPTIGLLHYVKCSCSGRQDSKAGSRGVRPQNNLYL